MVDQCQSYTEQDFRALVEQAIPNPQNGLQKNSNRKANPTKDEVKGLTKRLILHMQNDEIDRDGTDFKLSQTITTSCSILSQPSTITKGK